MTSSDFSIIANKLYFNPKWKKVQVSLPFTTLSTEPEVDQMVFFILPAGKNSTVW